MKYRGDFSKVSIGFGAFAAAAGAAHVCVFLGSGLRHVLPPGRLASLIPTITVPGQAWHVLYLVLWSAVSALCVAAMIWWARHWFGRVDARDWARNLAQSDRPEPSLR